MHTRILADEECAARTAATLIAKETHAAVSARGRFVLAVSGGQTPRILMHALASEDVPWQSVHAVQVDEPVAPAGYQDRNLTHLQATLLEATPIPRDQIHVMPVEESDLEVGAKQYAATIAGIAGSPFELDLVHLSLGPDGHMPSRVPSDPVSQVNDADVALSGVYQGRRRMTLTYPALDRARKIPWSVTGAGKGLVTGAGKAPMLARLHRCDQSIPAGMVRRDRAIVVADRLAAVPVQVPEGWIWTD